MMEGKNIILGPKAREKYAAAGKIVERYCPKMAERKFPLSRVQQNFMFEEVSDLAVNLGDKILSIGAYEDTAYCALKAVGYDILGIDPVFSCTLADFVAYEGNHGKYKVSFATSVIEHVKDDEKFLRDMVLTIQPGGYGLLTTDFMSDFDTKRSIPPEDFRMYTPKDLKQRIVPFLESMECKLVGEPDWDNPIEDFHYAGVNYTFASLVFQKKG